MTDIALLPTIVSVLYIDHYTDPRAYKECEKHMGKYRRIIWLSDYVIATHDSKLMKKGTKFIIKERFI